MPFQVTYGDESWMVDDLTLDEAGDLEKLLGRPWYQMNPLLSAQDCKAVIVAFLSRTMDATAAGDKVGSMPIGKILDHIKVVKDDDLPITYRDGVPLAAGDQETDGSSPAPDVSGGPPT